MKKFLAIGLTALLLTGCGAPVAPAPVSTTTVPTTTTAPPPEPELVKAASTAVLSCCFKEQILPSDHELSVGLFPPEEGKMYIDLTMQVENTGEAPIGAEDITAYFQYEGRRYDMQFEVEENAGNFANEDRTVHPGDSRIVHLFYTVDAAARDMVVHYSILGEGDQMGVDDYVPPVLEDKTQLKIGDTFGHEGRYSVTVMDCMVGKHLRATGNGAQKYYVADHDVLVMTVKLRNESAEELELVEGYLMMGQAPEFAQISVESEDHLTLTEVTEGCGVGPGEEQILHIWVAIPQDIPTEGMAMRLNILCDSFYCYPVG